MPVSRNTRNGAPRPRPARQARPAAAKKKPGAGTLSFLGEDYKLDTRVGVWPLLQFARAAESGLSTVDARGLAAIHAFLQDVIAPEDWGRFQEDMIKKKVDDLGELIDAAQQAVAILLERQQANGKPAGEVKVAIEDVVIVEDGEEERV